MYTNSRHPKAYVVSIFEIEEGHMLPQNKSELLKMMDDKVVIPFHARYCPECHRIPGAEKWIQDPGEGTFTFDTFFASLEICFSTKRKLPFLVVHKNH